MGPPPCALFVTLPGYEGLYFQGVGANPVRGGLRLYRPGLPPGPYRGGPPAQRLGETSARQTIALTEHLLAQYAIDPDRVYLEGYSGGGETGPWCWGAARPVHRLPGGEHPVGRGPGGSGPGRGPGLPGGGGEADSYYGSEPLRTAYAQLRALYEEKGLSQEAIDALLVLDVRDQAYFTQQGYTDQHAGGGAFASDPAVMGWLFQQ